jgi:tRNA A37 methylthiotransferase MiaB
MRKIIFCFFAQNTIQDYTPLDLGYIVAQLARQCRKDTEILELSPGSASPDDNKASLDQDVELISYHNPRAVFFFLDNILWSGVYALGRAEKVAKKLREKLPDVFLGMQSYKFRVDETAKLLGNGIADVVVKKNPTESFRSLDKILCKEKVNGVVYFDKKKSSLIDYPESDYLESDYLESNLDHLSSPYLTGIFDNYVAKKQNDSNDQFSCFLYSTFGCPFKCFYCFRSVKHDKLRFFSVKRFFDEIEYLLDNLNVKRFFILDDSFLSNKSRQADFTEEFEKRKKKNPGMNEIRLNAMIRPELIDRPAVDFLESINIDWVQIGLQTVNPKLDRYIGRQLPLKGFNDIAKWFRERGIRLHVDVIIGLPDDTLEYFKKTLEYALKLKPYAMQVKQLYLNPDTLFFNNQEEYEIVTNKQKRRDFTVPFIVKARGIDEKYIREATNFTIEKIRHSPSVKWKLVTIFKHFVSGFHKEI